MLNDEIRIALQTIYDRTGLIIPDIFYLEVNDLMKIRWTVNGTYDALSQRISFVILLGWYVLPLEKLLRVLETMMTLL